MKPAFYELRQRRPVWEALSELFVATDVTRTRYWRVRTLAASPYSVAELEEILINEVYPICRTNRWSVVGGWTEFDQCWLERRVLRRLRSPLRVLHGLNLGRLTIPRSTEWGLTKRGIEAYRQQQEPTDPYARRQGSRSSTEKSS
jgi:hypothetical protein